MFIRIHSYCLWKFQTQPQPQTPNPESLRAQKEGAKTRAKLVSQLEDHSSLMMLSASPFTDSYIYRVLDLLPIWWFKKQPELIVILFPP